MTEQEGDVPPGLLARERLPPQEAHDLGGSADSSVLIGVGLAEGSQQEPIRLEIRQTSLPGAFRVMPDLISLRGAAPPDNFFPWFAGRSG